MDRQGPPLPAYADIEVALLNFLAMHGATKPQDVYGPLAEQFDLTREQRRIERHDNSTPLWNNRVQWARKSLKDKGYLAKKLGVWELTPAGLSHAQFLDGPDL